MMNVHRCIVVPQPVDRTHHTRCRNDDDGDDDDDDGDDDRLIK